MTLDLSTLIQDVTQALEDLQATAQLEDGKLLVIGTSTSEVIGQRIGTAGTEDVAKALWEAFFDFQQTTGVALAFQCCEHLNRALVVEKTTAVERRLEPVSVIPVSSAGGSMAAFAFQQMNAPVVVEELRADAGIDIGDTFIGMHLKKVAVPVRSEVKTIGSAHVTMARTRPKLIGGERAVYRKIAEDQTCH
ncbi:TIGR01440 family protein [Evansella caseinilytica]|uniref:UPF0340 protein SAMN05421736_11360 n=1 Tax=Evansella caseinilytica TaxID=1503961 RepID=A0A1H3T890_9BACI|nr:TIGR01440 family protein [Evansella caseinilytica]SDZ45559.1 TIGR01440 family protein [Evansella caseinilytica]